jgi:hypothetical protein
MVLTAFLLIAGGASWLCWAMLITQAWWRGSPDWWMAMTFNRYGEGPLELLLATFLAGVSLGKGLHLLSVAQRAAQRDPLSLTSRHLPRPFAQNRLDAQNLGGLLNPALDLKGGTPVTVTNPTRGSFSLGISSARTSRNSSETRFGRVPSGTFSPPAREGSSDDRSARPPAGPLFRGRHRFEVGQP